MFSAHTVMLEPAEDAPVLDLGRASSSPSLESHGGSISRGNSSISDHSVLVNVVGAYSTGPAQSTVTTAVSTDSTDAAAKPLERNFRWKLVNYVLIPVSLPLLAAYWLLALLCGMMASFMIWPSLLLAARLYWACPFIPYIWRSPAIRGKFGVLGSWLLRLQFEGAHCATVVSRLLTLPMRPHLPDFYLLGFPVSGGGGWGGWGGETESGVACGVTAFNALKGA
jgi:hypothetical protein